ncbi:poly-gamma-glutamate biosynthesis protein PgsC/CapC [Streptomyces afghaniensis]|uniref:Poly-gamma-glutamate biosynthesis protein PgsC/CapC n=9 Tax=Streptomyces TaxID=1883 RepID=A0ABZ0KAD5_STRC4|nr:MULTISPECIES: poly-gamma-glutamate biosynthesis protein PgsC/CapC [Streptomyces]EPJ35520.1 putative PGA biosynthesis protein CapC [Streptomyces afghaniensis 772]MBB3076360.1 poly-gamma-glutamate biosynthesis protein PgsC/CapC [Streptomyces violarus]MCT9144441.1 poly-gamma-glutamate biosynthesis protein PgsC/CapC [Streptomyces violarus]MDG9708265.1 poly-gamma-glutamate biosynthesis protein PgsC/CapC [Streptomyces sp. DH10]MDQ0750661.1 poly-gamma-glutamate biosynthesis protein PgsC/CapC [Stre
MTTAALTPEMAALGIAIGLFFSLLCYLTTNLSPGGMITPGWLALTLIEDLQRAAMVVGVTALTYAGTKVMQRLVILYGKRLFAAVVLLGVLLQATVMIVLSIEFPLLYGNQTLGFIVPGLIAYQMVRQPKGATLLATGTVSLMAYIVVAAGLLLGIMPTV